MVRVLVVGPPRSGKTMLVSRMIGSDATWCDDYVQTMGTPPGPRSGTEHHRVDHDGQTLYIWDLGGRERPVQYLGGADVYLVVFDISSRRSYENIGPWLAAFEHAHVIIVGAKSDAVRAVAYDEAEALARRFRATYFETSSKTGDGFISLLRHISSRPQVVRLDQPPSAPAQSESCYQ